MPPGNRVRPKAPSSGTFRRSLKTASNRGDPPRVEAEPVHPAHVARVLDLEAAIHDDGNAAILGDPRRLLVDHPELAPERAGTDRDSLASDRGQRIRRAEDVDDVDRHG